VRRIVAKALDKDPTLRYQCVSDLRADLERALADFKSQRGIPLGPAPPPAAAERPAGRKGKWLAAGLGLAVLAGATALVVRTRRPARLAERGAVVLADFANSTGEPVFDEALKQALAVDLEQSPYIDIVPEQRVRETLAYMGRPVNERLTGTLAREVCARQSAQAALTGSIVALGKHYVIGLEAVRCDTGDTLAREQVEAASREQVIESLGRAAASLRGKLGASLGAIERQGTRLEQATTSSLEALNAFSIGTARRIRGMDLESVSYFQRAVELDPEFALAYARLAAVYITMGETRLAAENASRAYERRERVSAREKLDITARYYETVTGELDSAIETYGLWARAYPRDYTPHANLASLYNQTGEFGRAVEESSQALRLNPSQPRPQATLARAQAALGQLAEARAICERATATSEHVTPHFLLYQLAFASGERQLMARQSEWARGRPDEHLMLLASAQAAASEGRLREARGTYQAAAGHALRAGLRETAAAIASAEALTEALFGNAAQARKRAAEALALARNRTALARAAAALERALSPREAAPLLEELGRRFPRDTLVTQLALPIAQALRELASGRPLQAIKQLEPAARYELGTHAPFLAPYARGLAHLETGRGAEAVHEFEKITTQRGVDPASPLYPLALLGLVRARAAAGDAAGGRAACADLRALWQGADRDAAVCQEAARECAQRLGSVAPAQ
jgi:Tfp pilus assembly protein PilF